MNFRYSSTFMDEALLHHGSVGKLVFHVSYGWKNIQILLRISFANASLGTDSKKMLLLILSFGFHLRPRSLGSEVEEVDCVVQTLVRFYGQKAILSRDSWKVHPHKLNHNLKTEKPVLKLFECSSCHPKPILMTSFLKKCPKLQAVNTNTTV